MEFISLGGIPQGLTINDIVNGISLSRNPQLAQIFFRLRHIEAYGTGIRRIFELYRNCSAKPTISATENSFRITLPNMNLAKQREVHAEEVSDNAPSNSIYVTDQMQQVLDYFNLNSELDEGGLMNLLGIKRTQAYLVARQMVDRGLLDVRGRGKTKKYIRKSTPNKKGL